MQDHTNKVILMHVYWPHCYMGSTKHICIGSDCFDRYSFNMVAGTITSLYTLLTAIGWPKLSYSVSKRTEVSKGC